jgi:cullin 4
VIRWCLQGKDMFEAFYKKDFAKRLLMSRSVSTDVEKSLIGKLKFECGSQYTSKLEGMFKDEQVSKDMGKAFKDDVLAQSKMPKGLDANVRILTSGFWPSYPVVNANLPDEINRCDFVAAFVI